MEFIEHDIPASPAHHPHETHHRHAHTVWENLA